MANILQVTTPNLNTDNRNTPNPMDPRYSGEHSAVRNPVDPTRVVRADGRDGEQTGNTGQKDVFGAINYESNYSAFIKGLGENQDVIRIDEDELVIVWIEYKVHHAGESWRAISKSERHYYVLI